jgi:hypothetical protein
LAGVSNWRPCLEALRTLGVKTVRLAFDADFAVKPQVRQALRAAHEGLRAEGFVVELELWDLATAKGIDDLLLAGHTPRVLVGGEVENIMSEPSPTSNTAPPEDDLLTAPITDAKATLAKALEPAHLAALVKASREDPGPYGKFLFALKAAGATQREVDELNRAVNRQAKIKKERPQPTPAPASTPKTAELLNYTVEEYTDEDGNRRMRKVGLPNQTIAGNLLALTRGWPKRVSNWLFAPDEYRPLWLTTPNDLLAWASRHLPGDSKRNCLVWAKADDMPTEARFHAYLNQTVERYDWVESYPHHPPMPRHFYLHPEVKGGDAHRTTLRRFLDFFSPATNIDRDLLLAAVLTQLWGGEAGARPAFLITTDDQGDDQRGRGAGKSSTAQALAGVLGGYIEVQPSEKMADVKTRLLSEETQDKRAALIDNIKSLRFSWAELEGMVTQQVISGRRLYAGEGRRPNTLTWFLTVNGASLSKDMAMRCVIIHLTRPTYRPGWLEDMRAFLDAERWSLIGDALAVLRGQAGKLESYSRWSLWERDVLARLPEPADAQKVIAERQGCVDDDDAEAALVRERFVAELRCRNIDPQTDAAFIPSALAALWLCEAAGEKMPTNRASAHLATLAIGELRKSSDDGQRGFRWQGKDCSPGKAAQVVTALV